MLDARGLRDAVLGLRGPSGRPPCPSRQRARPSPPGPLASPEGEAKGAAGIPTANLRNKILDFRGFDSSIIFILRGGILMFMSIGNFPESLGQQIFVGRILVVRRLGVSLPPTVGGAKPPACRGPSPLSAVSVRRQRPSNEQRRAQTCLPSPRGPGAY